MKKKILALTMSLMMALGFSACGSQPASGSSSDAGQQESSIEESSSEESSAGESSAGESSAGETSALADWYNSEDRTALEETINNMFNSSGLTFFVTIEEPGTIIYNYQYTEQQDLSGATQEDIDAAYAATLDAGASAVISDIGTYQTTYGIPLTTIRMSYLNADGSLIYSMDITEDYVPASDGDASDDLSAGTYDSLQAWLDSAEAATTIETINEMLASSGITVDLTADGNTLVYEYYFSDDLGLDSLTEEQLASTLDPIVEEQSSTFASLLDSMESSYGLVLDGVRFSFFTEDGTPLYSSDITNE